MKLSEITAKTLQKISNVITIILQNWLIILVVVGFITQFFIGKDNIIEEKIEEIYKYKTGENLELSPDFKE